MGVFAETVFFAVPRLVFPKLGEKGGNLAIRAMLFPLICRKRDERWRLNEPVIKRYNLKKI